MFRGAIRSRTIDSVRDTVAGAIVKRGRNGAEGRGGPLDTVIRDNPLRRESRNCFSTVYLPTRDLYASNFPRNQYRRCIRLIFRAARASSRTICNLRTPKRRVEETWRAPLSASRVEFRAEKTATRYDRVYTRRVFARYSNCTAISGSRRTPTKPHVFYAGPISIQHGL